MALSWSVTYKNKKVYHYDTDNFNTAHIDSEQLDIITLKDPNALIPTLILHFDEPGKKPIFYMRRQLPSAKMPFETRCHVVGWQMNVNGKNIQAINYVFETIGRKIMIEDHTHPEGKREVIEEMCWIESAGRFDKTRDSWFKAPSEERLKILGSKVKK